MQNTSAYEEPRSSGKQLHEYSFDKFNVCKHNVRHSLGFKLSSQMARLIR